MTLASEILGRRMRLPRPQTRDVVCEQDLRVPMDDGAVLLADRWVARGRRAEPQPTVLVRSPYGRRQLVGVAFGRLLAERGLQVVIQSIRGTFGSEGEFNAFDERDDGLATLRWLRAQPWHAGGIGTIGPSYLGFVQWAMATADEEGLAAMSVHVSASQFHGHTYAGTSVALENVAEWLVLLGAQERHLGVLLAGWSLRRLPALMAELPLTQLDERATGAAVTWYREGFGSPRRDSPYWTHRDFSAGVPEVTAPVQFIGGWYDILLPWMLEDFEAMQAAGRQPQLLVGPWTHISPDLASAAEREGIAWLRAHLLGDDRLVSPAAVRIMVTGERSGGGWRELEAWPPPGTTERRLYLHTGRRLGDEPPGPQAESVTDGYRYDPADPTPALGGPILLARHPVIDQAPLESRPDVLTYTGPPLPATVEAIGHVAVELWLRGSQPYFDVFARVCDVDADGVSRNVCDALSSVAPDRHERLPDGSWRVRFELWPMAHRFAAGHRIRLLVASGAYPRYARNPGTGEDPAAATADRMQPVDIEVLHDADHPSALVLPAAG